MRTWLGRLLLRLPAEERDPAVELVHLGDRTEAPSGRGRAIALASHEDGRVELERRRREHVFVGNIVADDQEPTRGSHEAPSPCDGAALARAERTHLENLRPVQELELWVSLGPGADDRRRLDQ